MTATTQLTGVHLLAAASAVAARAHAGQADALGAPYLGHVNRVIAYAEALRARHDPDLDRFTVAATAALHDVLEDSELGAADLRDLGFPQMVIEAVSVLTHTPHTPRQDYLRAVADNPVARLVKIADTRDNADPVRLRHVHALDPERARRLTAKYADAWRILSGDSPP